MVRQQQSRGGRAAGSVSSYIAVPSVDEVEVAEEVVVEVRVRVFRTGHMSGYVPIQVDWSVVQSGRVAWDLFSGRLPGIVLLLDLTRGFVLDCGCLYADVCGARTTAGSCWRQVVLVTRNSSYCITIYGDVATSYVSNDQVGGDTFAGLRSAGLPGSHRYMLSGDLRMTTSV